MPERLTNDFQTTVGAGGIGNLVGNTSLPVSAAAVLDLRNPAGQGADFTIRVEDADGSGKPAGTNVEYMRVTGSGAAGASPWTVVRAQEGSAVVAHPAGSIVTQIYTRRTYGAALSAGIYPGRIVGEMHSLSQMSVDPADFDGTGDILSSGVTGFLRMPLFEPLTFTKIACWCTASPTTTTLMAVGIMDSAGLLRGQFNFASVMGTLGYKQGTLVPTAGRDLVFTPSGWDDFYLFTWLWTGTGTIRLARRRAGITGAAILNQATRGDALRFWQTGGAQTVLADANLATTGRVEGNHLFIGAG